MKKRRGCTHTLMFLYKPLVVFGICLASRGCTCLKFAIECCQNTSARQMIVCLIKPKSHASSGWKSVTPVLY